MNSGRPGKKWQPLPFEQYSDDILFQFTMHAPFGTLDRAGGFDLWFQITFQAFLQLRCVEVLVHWNQLDKELYIKVEDGFQ